MKKGQYSVTETCGGTAQVRGFEPSQLGERGSSHKPEKFNGRVGAKPKIHKNPGLLKGG